MVKETWFDFFGGIYFKKHSHLKRSFDRAIIAFREAGSIEKLIDSYTRANLVPQRRGTDDELTVLSLSHYEVPMYLVAVMLGISTLVFLLEQTYGSCIGRPQIKNDEKEAGTEYKI